MVRGVGKKYFQNISNVNCDMWYVLFLVYLQLRKVEGEVLIQKIINRYKHLNNDFR